MQSFSVLHHRITGTNLITVKGIKMLTQERLKEILDYDALTGLFINKVRRGNRSRGSVAGTAKAEGYIQLQIDGEFYYAHQLAWLFIYGVWPTNQIDHINTIKHHNYIANLRDVNVRVNAENKIKAQRNNISSKLLGVSYDNRRNKFYARIHLSGKKKFLGYFDTAELAYKRYLDAKRILHIGCTI